ncbi:ion transporter [Butyrivibrio sp. AC2005]|uniref:ion transporter n=1 Tax=Butyrivibrio sp. AC2005 TaxID=1280672 RepID=UPI0003FA4552|nr:ion transporter [Butyrivibrio sp. AC2005]
MRKKIYEIIEVAEDDNQLSRLYDVIMLFFILLSIIPLTFKETNRLFYAIDKITVSVFIMDYALRWITADYKLEGKKMSFVRYPFTVWAIVDLLSILPSLTTLKSGFKLLRLFRMIRTFRIFRIFKALRYSKSLIIIINVLKKSRQALFAVCSLAIGYVLVAALVIFCVEPESFSSFFDAIYWATVSLTTVGYGDIYPVTVVGRVVTMFSSFFGIAIVALPAGIITAGYMKEVDKKDISE